MAPAHPSAFVSALQGAGPLSSFVQELWLAGRMRSCPLAWAEGKTGPGGDPRGAGSHSKGQHRGHMVLGSWVPPGGLIPLNIHLCPPCPGLRPQTLGLQINVWRTDTLTTLSLAAQEYGVFLHFNFFDQCFIVFSVQTQNRSYLIQC